ncbi:MAG TPA: pilus assembly PilX N-terminal domain-containing protein [Tepidisphaeraceae bacterium]|nr:pilus assembly PilX N-terminal domain-containing protein [Tepidisphaeraceae bacterium]
MYRIATPIAPARTSRIGPTPRTGASSRAALRRGVASLFAMLYLLVFSTLAIGFYSAVTLSVQVAHNDERGLGAQAAAESGLEFLRYQLIRVRFPSNTEPDRIFNELVTDLTNQTLNTPNLQGRSINVDYDNRIIYFPGSDNGYMIPLDDRGSRFRATIQDAGNRTITKTLEDGRVQRRTVRAMRVRVLGRYKGEKIARAIEMEFWGDYNTLSVFDFGVATRGPITLTGQGGVFGPNSLDGSVLTTWDGNTPVTMTGNTIIAGKIFTTNPDANISLSSGASVGGTSTPDKWNSVKKGVEQPEFPTVDSTPFRQYATNPYRPGQSLYRNTFVPARANPNFSSDTVIEGVMYVQHPNKLSFTSKVTIRGVIVVENGAIPGRDNQVSFGGGIEAFGLDTLPDNADFPPSMKKLRGSVLLAPGMAVELSGSSGTIGGTMVADGFALTGGSGGVVRGNLISLGKTGFTVSGGGSIQRTRTEEIPDNLIFNFNFQPQHNTYTEVIP